MADHIHKQIRDAAAARIGTATLAGPRIFPGRLWPMGAQHLDCVTLHTPEERITPTVGGDEDHSLTFVAMLWVKDLPSAPVNDKLDAMAVQIHGAILTDYSLGGLKIMSIEATGSKLEQASLGEVACAALGLTYSIRYMTPRGVSDQFL